VGVTKLPFDGRPDAHGHGKILGGGMVGIHAGDMIGEVALAIEMGADAVDIGTHPPPPNAGREHRHGSGSCARQLHGRGAACAEVNSQPKWPLAFDDKAQTAISNEKPELATVRALCFAYSIHRCKILCI
jgi:hypothetical protein